MMKGRTKARILQLRKQGFKPARIATMVGVDQNRVLSVLYRKERKKHSTGRPRILAGEKSQAVRELLNEGFDPAVVAANFPDVDEKNYDGPNQADQGATHMPSREEIEAATAELRKDWSEVDHWKRLVGFAVPSEYEVPQVADPWGDY